MAGVPGLRRANALALRASSPHFQWVSLFKIILMILSNLFGSHPGYPDLSSLNNNYHKLVTITACMAGVPGFEPGNAGIKIQCLTAWRYPN